MPRIAGIDLPENKPAWIALTSLYGVGRQNAVQIMKKAAVQGEKKAGALTAEEVARLNKVLEEYLIEGDLRRQIAENIKRLREIGSYRGIRHSRNLPVRGQRTRSNARTKRGKRVTIGALKKEVLAKQTTSSPQETTKETPNG